MDKDAVKVFLTVTVVDLLKSKLRRMNRSTAHVGQNDSEVCSSIAYSRTDGQNADVDGRDAVSKEVFDDLYNNHGEMMWQLTQLCYELFVSQFFSTKMFPNEKRSIRNTIDFFCAPPVRGKQIDASHCRSMFFNIYRANSKDGAPGHMDECRFGTVVVCVTGGGHRPTYVWPMARSLAAAGDKYVLATCGYLVFGRLYYAVELEKYKELRITFNMCF